MLAIYLSMLEDAGDREPFTALYENCKGRALYVAMGIVKEQALAEDAVHEGFCYLAEHYQRLKRNYPLGLEGYLFQCVESRALNILRARKREQSGAEELLSAAESREAVPERQVEGAEQLERTIAAVQALPDIYRTTLELYCSGWPMAEIAGAMGVSEKTAQKRLERARKMVRKEVGEDDG